MTFFFSLKVVLFYLYFILENISKKPKEEKKLVLYFIFILFYFAFPK